MDFNQLEYFVSVAQTLNFTQAAKIHYITQPAISRRITDLEKELGVQLFIRNSHQVVLTGAGEEFFRYAQSVLESTAAVKQRIRALAEGKTGIIRISAVPTSEPTVNRVLTRFVQDFPNVQIELKFSTGVAQIAGINSGTFDFYFSFENLLQSSGKLTTVVTDVDRYQLFVPGEYAHRVDIHDFRSFGDLPLIMESRVEGPFLVEQVLRICHARGYDTNNMISCNDVNSVVACANAGMGFTLFPMALGRSINTDHLVAFTLDGDDACTTNAIGWNPENTNTTAAQFRKTVIALYGKPGAEAPPQTEPAD